VTALVYNGSTWSSNEKAIPFKNGSCGTIPVTSTSIVIADAIKPTNSGTIISGNTITSGATLDYDLWYY
jgi:hypothetical protein